MRQMSVGIYAAEQHLLLNGKQHRDLVHFVSFVERDRDCNQKSLKFHGLR
jgi:hypothetical protein